MQPDVSWTCHVSLTFVVPCILLNWKWMVVMNDMLATDVCYMNVNMDDWMLVMLIWYSETANALYCLWYCIVVLMACFTLPMFGMFIALNAWWTVVTIGLFFCYGWWLMQCNRSARWLIIWMIWLLCMLYELLWCLLIMLFEMVWIVLMMMLCMCWLVCSHGPVVNLVMEIMGCNLVFLNKCPSHDLYGCFNM